MSRSKRSAAKMTNPATSRSVNRRGPFSSSSDDDDIQDENLSSDIQGGRKKTGPFSSNPNDSDEYRENDVQILKDTPFSATDMAINIGGSTTSSSSGSIVTSDNVIQRELHLHADVIDQPALKNRQAALRKTIGVLILAFGVACINASSDIEQILSRFRIFTLKNGLGVSAAAYLVRGNVLPTNEVINYLLQKINGVPLLQWSSLILGLALSLFGGYLFLVEPPQVHREPAPGNNNNNNDNNNNNVEPAAVNDVQSAANSIARKVSYMLFVILSTVRSFTLPLLSLVWDNIMWVCLFVAAALLVQSALYFILPEISRYGWMFFQATLVTAFIAVFVFYLRERQRYLVMRHKCVVYLATLCKQILKYVHKGSAYPIDFLEEDVLEILPLLSVAPAVPSGAIPVGDDSFNLRGYEISFQSSSGTGALPGNPPNPRNNQVQHRVQFAPPSQMIREPIPREIAESRMLTSFFVRQCWEDVQKEVARDKRIQTVVEERGIPRKCWRRLDYVGYDR